MGAARHARAAGAGAGRRAARRSRRVIRRPPLLGSGQLTFLLWQARADSSRARSELGVEFRPWEEGVRETVRWMAQTGRI